MSKNVRVSKIVNIYTVFSLSLECSSTPPLIHLVLIPTKLLLQDTPF